MKAFLNVNSMDFNAAESMAPTQEWELSPDNPRGLVEYPTKYTKFQNITTLWLFITANYGASKTEIQYLGFKGEHTGYRREPISTVYEIRPLAAEKDLFQANQRGGLM
mmetsp:Transcript_5061/g.10265  ORF Transcript_5061/g.10265 Transcript_5061/m.10265 type:complete len:108 (-) Transcript_5061:2631-2954(-)